MLSTEMHQNSDGVFYCDMTHGVECFVFHKTVAVSLSVSQVYAVGIPIYILQRTEKPCMYFSKVYDTCVFLKF
jgi:hypothetical protein